MSQKSSGSLRVDLILLRTQNGFAALQVQRTWRGYMCRCRLWHPLTGRLTHHAVTKIQRVFRGVRGRERAYNYAKARMNNYAAKIQNLKNIFVAKRELRILRAEKVLSRIILLQRKFRDRRQRRLYAIFMLKLRDEKTRKLQRLIRGHFGCKRWSLISRRCNNKVEDIKRAIKTDTILSANFTLKVNVSMLTLNFSSEWDLLDYTLLQFVGSSRQVAYVNAAIYCTRKYPNFFYGKFVLCVILLNIWSSYGSQRLFVEDMLSEAIELLETLRFEADVATKEFTGSSSDIPPSLRLAHPFSTYNKRLEDPVEAVLEELEMIYFAAAIRKLGMDEVSLSQMAFFVLARSFVTKDERRSKYYLSRSKELLRRARLKAKTKNAEEMYYRMEVFHNMFELERKLVLVRKRPFKDCVLSDSKDSYQVRKGARDDRPRVNVELAFFQRGDMLVVEAQFAEADRKTKPRAQTSSLVPETPAVSHKFHNMMKIKPLVLLVRDVTALLEYSIPFLSKALRQKPNDIERRGRAVNVAEYLFHELEIVSFESKWAVHTNCREQQTWPWNSTIVRSTPFSRTMLTLPVLEYRHRERNNGIIEEYGIKLLQRAYRGFRGRALWRRLSRRKQSRILHHETTRNKIDCLAKVHLHRYMMASTIQALVRGFLWRATMKLLNTYATTCQRMFRGYRGKNRAKAERRRQMFGVEVVEMMRRGTVISEMKITLVIYRCGLNYRLLAQDLINNAEYHGNVWSEEVSNYLNVYNKQFGDSLQEKQKRVMPWQHERVVELLADNLSIAKRIVAATSQLGADSVRNPLVLVFAKGVHGRGITQKCGLQRVLKDQKGILLKLKRWNERQQKAQKGKNKKAGDLSSNNSDVVST